MSKEIKSKLEEVVSLISEDKLDQPLIELSNRDENEQLWDFIEEIGTIRLEFEISQEPSLARFTTMSGKQDLLYKRVDGTWVIKLYLINGILDK